MFSVPYSKGQIEFGLPDGMEGICVEPQPHQVISDHRQAIASALADPISAPRLRELARGKRNVCLIVTDITRVCPDHELVPPILAELAAGGVHDEEITILVGTGLHRGSTEEERIEMLGSEVVSRIRIVDHDGTNRARLVDLGVTSTGVPAVVDKLVVDSDLVVATGIVEPHQYAGYSGGRKTLSVGCGGEDLIGRLHSPTFIDNPGTRLGQIEGNLFHQTVTEIARMARLQFVLNVVLDSEKDLVAVAGGAPEPVFMHLVEVARRLYTVSISAPADVAVAGVGYPKDANLYQASRAASYLVFGPSPAVRSGGVVIVPARAQEGAGQGPGEQTFYKTMSGFPTPKAVVEYIRGGGYKPGAQRAYVMAQVLEHCSVVVVGTECPDVVRELHMIPMSTMDDALVYAQQIVGTRATALILPHALLTVPVIGP